MSYAIDDHLVDLVPPTTGGTGGGTTVTYLSSTNPNAAQTGTVRLGPSDTITYRLGGVDRTILTADATTGTQIGTSVYPTELLGQNVEMFSPPDSYNSAVGIGYIARATTEPTAASAVGDYFYARPSDGTYVVQTPQARSFLGSEPTGSVTTKGYFLDGTAGSSSAFGAISHVTGTNTAGVGVDIYPGLGTGTGTHKPVRIYSVTATGESSGATPQTYRPTAAVCVAAGNKVGINNESPGVELDVTGSVRISTLSAGAVLYSGSVLYSGDSMLGFSAITPVDVSAGGVINVACSSRSIVLTGTAVADAGLFDTLTPFEGKYVEITNTTTQPFLQTFQGLWVPPGNTVGFTYTNGAWRYASGSGGAFTIKVSQTISATFSGTALFRVPARWRTKPGGCGVRVKQAMTGGTPSAFTLTDQTAGDVIASFAPAAVDTWTDGTATASIGSNADRNITGGGTITGVVTQNLILCWEILVQDTTSV